MVANPFLDEHWATSLAYSADYEIRVRIGKRADVPALAELERLTFRKPWTAKQLDDQIKEDWKSTYLLAVTALEGQEYLLAYISWWQILDQADILNLSVHPLWRRRGIAKALLARALEAMEATGIKKVTLEVAKKKTAAQALYLQNGFYFAGEIKNYYPEYDDDALIMNKDLN